ncbi:hypothetical protein E8E01_19325 [Methylorubrum populi]|uniref:hypothetical protein n=1 Tax=Methylorubrum populi TaxID=223967 RepID=UPI00114FE927|nr:hypothetical protein [Methylorubrum populi]QDI82415.1 hypothetical protein E8E01_19325 [Methylorubrum populi]
MSHVSPSHAAAVSHHAIRRYAERVLGATVPAGLPDWAALAHVRAQGWDCDAIRARLAGVGGLIVAAGMRAGVVVVPEECCPPCGASRCRPQSRTSRPRWPRWPR